MVSTVFPKNFPNYLMCGSIEFSLIAKAGNFSFVGICHLSGDNFKRWVDLLLSMSPPSGDVVNTFSHSFRNFLVALRIVKL